MAEPAGLRARKKARTRDAIADAAISLFLARGFDQVSVADIAAAAEVRAGGARPRGRHRAADRPAPAFP